MVVKIYSLRGAARAMKRSRQWLEKLVKDKDERVAHPLEDERGRPYWYTPPEKLKPLKRGWPKGMSRKKDRDAAKKKK